jgi:hypothetical protein
MRHILCNYARDRRRPRHVSSQRQADWAFARAWLLREMQLTLAGEE